MTKLQAQSLYERICEEAPHVPGIQLHISPALTLIEQVAPVENDEMTFRYKPKSTTGLWTSSWREETHDSDWVEWCRGEDFGDPDGSHWFLLTPKEDSKLYVIDCYADLERLLHDYKLESPLAKGLGESSHLRHYYEGIDFERLSLDFDALHLTYEGNNRLHHSYPLNMNAWVSESTIWFRWCFTQVQCIETPRLEQASHD